MMRKRALYTYVDSSVEKLKNMKISWKVEQNAIMIECYQNAYNTELCWMTLPLVSHALKLFILVIFVEDDI